MTDDGGARLRAHLRQPPDTGSEASTDVTVGLTRLCDVAAGELGMLAASVTLMTSPETQALAARSGGESDCFDELEFSHGEGPTPEAFAAGSPVVETDMAKALGRWPGFAVAASGAGIGAAFAFPLQLGASRFGVLVLYAGEARRLEPHERAQCLIYCDLVVEMLLDRSTRVLDDRPGPGLAGVLEMRTEVYQAQGMVMVDLGVGLAEALVRMRAFAFAEGRDLNDVARDVVAHRVRLPRDREPGDA